MYIHLISFCTKITDVSSLTKVHTLEISRYNNITNISALSGIPNLITLYKNQY